MLAILAVCVLVSLLIELLRRVRREARLAEELIAQRAQIAAMKVAEQGCLKVLNGGAEAVFKRFPESTITGSEVMDANDKDLPDCSSPVIVDVNGVKTVVGTATRYANCLVFPGHIRSVYEKIMLPKQRGKQVGFVSLSLYDDDGNPLYHVPSFNPDVFVLLCTQVQIASLGMSSARVAERVFRSVQATCISPAAKQFSVGKVMFDEKDITELSFFGSTKRGFSGAPYMVGKLVYGMHMSGSSGQVNFGVPFGAIKCFCDSLAERLRQPESVDSDTSKWLFNLARRNQGRIFAEELDDSNMLIYDTGVGRYVRIKRQTFEDFSVERDMQFEERDEVDRYVVHDAFKAGLKEMKRVRGHKGKRQNKFEDVERYPEGLLDQPSTSSGLRPPGGEHTAPFQRRLRAEAEMPLLKQMRERSYELSSDPAVVAAKNRARNVATLVKAVANVEKERLNESSTCASDSDTESEAGRDLLVNRLPPRVKFVQVPVYDDAQQSESGNEEGALQEPHPRVPLVEDNTLTEDDITLSAALIQSQKDVIEQERAEAATAVRRLTQSRSACAQSVEVLTQKMAQLPAGAEKKALVANFLTLQEELSDLNQRLKHANQRQTELKKATPEEEKERKRKQRQKKKKNKPQKPPQEVAAGVLDSLKGNEEVLRVLMEQLSQMKLREAGSLSMSSRPSE